jgi:transposase
MLYAVEGEDLNLSVASCDCLAHRFGNAADQPGREPAYGTDLTDAEWQEIRPLLPPVPAWLEGQGGRPEDYCHHQMLNAVLYVLYVLYVLDNGIKWRAMPVDFPAWDRVYAFFRRWRDGLIAEFHDRLRSCHVLPRGSGADGAALVAALRELSGL